jgi:hypothetical protein
MYKIKGGGWTTHPIQFYEETEWHYFVKNLYELIAHALHI